MAVAVLLAVQGGLSRYQQDLYTTVLLYAGMATAWNIIGGVAGQFSLANSAFVGAGAYSTAMLLAHARTGTAAALGGAVLVAALLGLAVGLSLFRLRGVYFTVGSLAVALGVQAWMTTWSYTGAATGLSVPLAAVPDPAVLCRMALGAAAASLAVVVAIRGTRYGLRLVAVRDDEEVADALGVPPLRMKLTAMVVSAALTGLLGGVYALQQVTIEPFSAFSLTWSINMIVMAVVGGLGTTWGPVVGTVVVHRGIVVLLEDHPTVSTALTGLLLVAIIRFAPRGLLGCLADAARLLRRGRWPRLPGWPAGPPSGAGRATARQPIHGHAPEGSADPSGARPVSQGSPATAGWRRRWPTIAPPRHRR